MRTKRCVTQKPSSGPSSACVSASAGYAASGGRSKTSPETPAVQANERTSVDLARSCATRRVLSSGWSLESFDLGFRAGRAVELGGLHIVLTSTESTGPFMVPGEVLAWLLTGEVPT